MSVASNLKAAKALIADPANWVQGQYAKDQKGSNNYLMGNDAGAVCFCSLGAIQKVMDTMLEEDTEEGARLSATAEELFGSSVAAYNDNHTHEEVMGLFDKAIEAAEKESA